MSKQKETQEEAAQDAVYMTMPPQMLMHCTTIEEENTEGRSLGGHANEAQGSCCK